MTFKRALWSVGLSLLLALSAKPVAAFPINFANSRIPSPGGGLLLLHPTLSAPGSAQTLWGDLELGIAERLSVSIDGLGLALPQVSDWGTSYLGVSYAPPSPAPWLGLRLTPLYGLKAGRFGEHQAALRAYLDVFVSERVTLYTMAAYHHSLEAGSGALRFDAAGEYHLAPGLAVALEVLAGTPSWEFGTESKLALAPGITASFGKTSLKLSARIPVVRADGAAALEAPFAALGVGTWW